MLFSSNLMRKICKQFGLSEPLTWVPNSSKRVAVMSFCHQNGIGNSLSGQPLSPFPIESWHPQGAAVALGMSYESLGQKFTTRGNKAEKKLGQTWHFLQSKATNSSVRFQMTEKQQWFVHAKTELICVLALRFQRNGEWNEMLTENKIKWK